MRPRILSTGYYLPQKKMSNEDLATMVDTSDEWIFSHTGIRFRHIAAPDEATSDLAVQASLRALQNAHLDPKEIDLILVATSTPDYNSFPATACIVQEKIGAINAAAMDLSAACTGFVYAFETARSYCLAGSARTILIIGAEVFSRVLNWKDRNTCVLFGDGAGAVLMVAEDAQSENPSYSSYLHSDGSGALALVRMAGGTRQPQFTDRVETCVTMDGRKVYDFAVRVIKDSIQGVLAKNNVHLSEVKWIVPHQANIRIVESAAKRLGIPLERFYLNIEKYANTSGATIPLALAEMDEKNLLSAGDLILTVGFGAGLTYGANLFYW